MIALKAQWAIYAGLIPGEDDPQYTRSLQYTSVDYAADGNHRGNRWLMLREKAQLYALGLESAAPINFTRIEYFWM